MFFLLAVLSPCSPCISSTSTDVEQHSAERSKSSSVSSSTTGTMQLLTSNTWSAAELSSLARFPGVDRFLWLSATELSDGGWFSEVDRFLGLSAAELSDGGWFSEVDRFLGLSAAELSNGGWFSEVDRFLWLSAAELSEEGWFSEVDPVICNTRYNRMKCERLTYVRITNDGKFFLVRHRGTSRTSCLLVIFLFQCMFAVIY